MAGNKYQQYLNEETASSRSLRSEEKFKSAVKITAGIAAIVGGGFGVRHLYKKGYLDGLLQETGSAINKMISKSRANAMKLGAFTDALGKTKKQAGLGKILAGDADDIFETHLRKNLERVHSNLEKPFIGVDTQIEELLAKRGRVKADAMKSYIEGHRLDAVTDELGKIFNKDSELFKDINQILRNDTNRRGLLDKANAKHFEGLFISKGFDQKYDMNDILGASQVLEDILKQYRGSPKNWRKPLSIDHLKKKSKQLGSIIDEDFMKLLEPKENKFLEKMGIRHATVEDALAHPEWFRGSQQYVGKRANGKIVDGGFVERNTYKKLQSLVHANPEAAKLTLGKSIMLDIKSGEMTDYRYISDAAWKFFEFAADNIQVPFVNINPLRLAHAITIEGVRKAEPMAILRRGTLQPFLEGSKDALQDDLLYSAGKVYSIKSGELIKDNTYLASSRYGLFKRIAENMGEFGHQKTGNKIQGLFDIGLQERESELTRQSSFFTKFFNPTWEPNLIYGMKDQLATKGEVSTNVAEVAYKKIYDTLNREVRPLDEDIMLRMAPQIQEMFPGLTEQDIAMETNEQVMITLGKLLNIEYEHTSQVYSTRTGILGQLRGNASLYEHNKDVFEMIQQAVSDPEMALPGFLDSLQPGNTRMVDKYTDTKRIIQQEILSQLEAHQVNFRGVLGELSERESTALSDITALNDMRRMWRAVHGLEGDTLDDAANNKKAALSHFAAAITNPTDKQKGFAEAVENAVNRYSPWWGYGPGQRPDSAFGNSPYILMNKTRNPIAEINEVIKSGGDYGDILKTLADTTLGQLGFDFGFGFRAGRKNLDKVTTLTAGAYYYFDRLNEGLARAGIGLSQKSLGSTQDVFKNLLVKRYGAVALGIAGLSYLDYETENVTGIEPSETLGKAYVNMSLDVARIKDVTGITDINKMLKRMMPGSEKLFMNPVGGALKYATFGIIGDERGYDEMKEYWTEGKDPIRKGRWWGIGSNTPWYGGKIDHYAPNWYRRMKSDYQYTDVLYGSKDEYWANHWMPTPSHPFAPIRRFLLDPNHWANKHRKDRPYPIVGGYSELNEIPIIGPALNGTIGQVLNPERRRGDLAKAHRQYITDINESIKDNIDRKNNGYVYMSPAGRSSIVAVDGGSGWGVGAETSFVATESGTISAVDATGGFAPMQSGRVISGAEITSINSGIVARASIGSIPSSNLEALRDDEYIENLNEVVDPRSLAYRLGETFYSVTEMGGIYGFAITAFTGELASKKPVMARSMDMASASRMFWDKQLGGAGGDLSEIGRRFIPRKRTEEEYNPYRNTQPDWTPGPEYFLDFRHGDPYAKIAGGEYRLPGAGYESLNRLHPDMFGQYGALDRFKILADVAPYSEQYNYYKKVLSKYNQMGWLSEGEKEDIQDIKEQVREAKKKYEFTHYKFKYANIDEQFVTIDYMVDDITFMAKEFPDHPIRLAGIDMPPKDDESDAAVAARQYLKEQLAPGKRVKVGLDADELFRVRDDTMQTMRAVVYDSYGQSISSRLARGKWNATMGVFGGDGIVEANWDDTSATTVHALYNPGEITIGKVWEFISHLDTPLHTKLLQNRSPLEQYKRRELYGKNWQSWTHPIRDWVKPTLNKMTQANPLIATAAGAFIGSLFSAKGGKKITATIGGIIAGGASTLRVAREAAGRVVDSDYTWIPKERVKERAIEEYFDVLEYVKYRGLYEKARKLAIRDEGVDIEKILSVNSDRGGRLQARRKALEDKKRWIKINMSNPMVDKDAAKAELDEVNEQLNEFTNERGIVKLGPIALQAMRYKSAYESTLYGADPHGDTVQIYRALPKKDREFFKEFLLAAPEEREEILRLVPENQRRFYQAKWGLKIDKKQDLQDYFENHFLPNASWEGWRPDVSLEAVKLKVVRNEAMDMGEFGFYPGDEKAAVGAPEVKPFKPSGFLNMGRLRQALRGMGLKNVDIKQAINPAEVNGFSIDVNLDRDRREEITGIMNSNLNSMFAT